ncbi:hypothetical protein RBWH47_03443 [Rhodopirellula baltica WH47]|uniref:Uncharacterized protein n=1 Tax=Rhodopirellula baltica WH47 TaxID=991778 RepID=F2B1V1_RHOBT|nr:hypothetical protein RBWH47_03443 [Rhodopirellula baltica WH47]
MGSHPSIDNEKDSTTADGNFAEQARSNTFLNIMSLAPFPIDDKFLF